MSEPIPPAPGTPGDPQPDLNEIPGDPSTPSTAPHPVPPAKPRKRKRRIPTWLKVVGVAVLLIGLVVLLAPTIAGMAPVRSFVLGKVNQNLNGKVEVADWSLGWAGGLKLEGLRVTDAGGQPVIQVGSLTTELSLIDVVRGNYSLGDAVVDGLEFNIRREVDGELNISKLTKSAADGSPSPAPATPEQPTTPAPPPGEDATRDPPTKLPDLSGRLVVRNSKGTYADVAKQQTVRVASIDGTVNIPDINGAIENDLTVVAAANDGPPGTLKLTGTVDAVQENEVRPEAANVDETITVQNLNLSTVAALLPPGGIERMDGVTNATVSLKMTAGQSGVLTAGVKTAGFAAGGPALEGDTFTARELSLEIPPTTIDLSPGFGGAWVNWPIRTGGDQPRPVAVTVRYDGYDDTLALAVNGATPQSLMNLAANLKPGAAGEVALDVTVNLGGLARQLPRVFPERDGKRLATGRLEQSINVKLTPDAATLVQSLSLLDLSLADASGKKVEKLEPIEQELRLSTYGGGWSMPDLRDIRLALASGFATAEFGGKRLTELAGTADGDLAKAQRELGPILPMEGMNLAGTFKVDLKAAGDVANPAAPVDLSLVATFAGLQLDGVGGLERFRQGHTRVEAAAGVVRSDAGVEAFNNVRVEVRTGRSERELTLDTRITADVKYVQTTARNGATGRDEPVRIAQVLRYAIERLNVSLPDAARDFPAQFASLNEQGVRVDSGSLALAGSGSYTPDNVAFDLKGGVSNLSLTRAAPTPAPNAAPSPGAAAASTSVLRDYTLTLDAAGVHKPVGTRVTRLDVADNQKMFFLRLGGGEIVLPTDTKVAPSGELALGADLRKLLDVSSALSGTATTTDGPQLQSGRIDGTLRLGAAPGPDNLIALTGQIDMTGLTVRTPEGEPVKNEKLALKPSLRLNRDLSVINVDFITVDGRLVQGRVFDTVVDAGAGDAANAPPLAAIRKANAAFQFPQLGDLHALVLAVSPPEAPDTTASPPGSAPLGSTAGSTGSAVASPPAPAPRGADVIGRVPGRGPRPAPAPTPAPDAVATQSPAEPSGDSAPAGRILGGSATMKLTLGHQGPEVVITPEITAKALRVGAGDVSKDVGDVTVRTVVRLAGKGAAPPDATFLETVSALTISTLAVNGAGASLGLEKPLVVKDPAGAATASGVLTGCANLAELLSAVEAWGGGKPGTIYPYAGEMTLRQELAASAGGAFSVNGSLGVKDFATTGEGGTTFAERNLSIVNALEVDPGAKALTIKNLDLATESTGAVRLSTRGVVREYDTARRFENVVVNLGYDAKALWDLIRPVMDPETGGKSLEEFTVAGKRTQSIEISGSYPAGDPRAVRFVRAAGGLTLDTLAGRGLSVSQLDLKFLLDRGILTLEHANAAAPATAPAPADGTATASAAENLPPGARCNDTGVLSFHGFTVDLNGEHTRLNTPANHPLIRGVSINPVVADTLLGRFVNPAFDGATQARGILDVTVVSCRDLALDEAMQSPSEGGRAQLRWSLTDLFLGQPELVGFVAKLKPNALNENGFTGSIRDGRIVLEGGQATSDMTFNVDKYALKFNGGIGLAENTLSNFFVVLPAELFAAIDDNFARHVPREGYRVALTGTTDNYLQNASKSVLPIVADLGVRAGLGSALDRALDRDRDKDRPRRAPDAGADAPPGAIGRPRADADARPENKPASPDDPLGGLLDRALGGDDRESDAEKEARRERVRAERREREAKEAAAATQPAATQPVADDRPLTKRERELRERERERQKQEERRRAREEKELKAKAERDQKREQGQ